MPHAYTEAPLVDQPAINFTLELECLARLEPRDS